MKNKQIPVFTPNRILNETKRQHQEKIKELEAKIKELKYRISDIDYVLGAENG